MKGNELFYLFPFIVYIFEKKADIYDQMVEVCLYI
jgi:hypothetical protein